MTLRNLSKDLESDLERAAAATPGAVLGNARQDCCARSRILV